MGKTKAQLLAPKLAGPGGLPGPLQAHATGSGTQKIQIGFVPGERDRLDPSTPKMGGEFSYQPEWDPKTVLNPEMGSQNGFHHQSLSEGICGLGMRFGPGPRPERNRCLCSGERWKYVKPEGSFGGMGQNQTTKKPQVLVHVSNSIWRTYF